LKLLPCWKKNDAGKSSAAGIAKQYALFQHTCPSARFLLPTIARAGNNDYNAVMKAKFYGGCP
jgi:hypothetical protein